MSSEATDPAREIADQCLAFRVRVLNRAVTRLFDEALREHGITVAQLNLLVATSLMGPVRATDLGHTLSIERSTLSRNLERLRARELVEELDSEDGRSTPLRATRAGKQLLRKVLPAWRSAQAEAEALLGSSTAQRLENAMRRVRQL